MIFSFINYVFFKIDIRLYRTIIFLVSECDISISSEWTIVSSLLQNYAFSSSNSQNYIEESTVANT